MHALAQIMAERAAKGASVPKLDERTRLDKRAAFWEMEYKPGEFVRKPSKYCEPDAPCHNYRDKSLWAAMSGGQQDVCPTCSQVAEELAEFLRDFPGWATTKEGRFAQWCAKVSREAASRSPLTATQGESEPQRTEDSKEPPSFG